MDEVHIISPVAFVLAVLPYVAVIAAMVFATLSGKPPMSLPAMVAVGTLGGTVLACYILLIGYINSDAGRRGMSRLAWTLLAILHPERAWHRVVFRIAETAHRILPAMRRAPRVRVRLLPAVPVSPEPRVSQVSALRTCRRQVLPLLWRRPHGWCERSGCVTAAAPSSQKMA